MQTKIEITLSLDEVLKRIPAADLSDGALCHHVANELDLSGEAGGWYWKVSRVGKKPETGADYRDVKLSGLLVPAGASVVG